MKAKLWRLQPDVAEHILREAPVLAETMLDGLIWRSHKTKARTQNVGLSSNCSDFDNYLRKIAAATGYYL